MIFSQFVQGLCCRCSWPYWSTIKPRLRLWLPWLLVKLTIHTQHCHSAMHLASERSHSSTLALRSSPCCFPILYFLTDGQIYLFFQSPDNFSSGKSHDDYDSAVKMTRWKILILSWEVQVLALGYPNGRCCMWFECDFPIFINHVDKLSTGLQVHSHNLNPKTGRFGGFAW